MENSVLLALGMLLSSSQGGMGIPNCNLTLCKCQTEKFENEESSLETKDYIIIALAIALFLLVVVLVMVGCYWKRKRNKDNTKTTENIEKQDKDNSMKDNGNIQETKTEIELVNDKPKTFAKEAQIKLDEKTRYTKEPSMPVVKTRTEHQSTKRIESATYENSEEIGLNRKLLNRVSNVFGQFIQRLRSTPDPSGGKGENMAELGKSNNTSNTSNARLASTSDTQEPINGNNEDLGNQTREHVPDVRNDNGENGNQVDTDSDTASYKSARDFASSTESSVKTGASSTESSVKTSASSTESSVKTSASSTENSVKTRVTKKNAHDEINASQSRNNIYVNVNNVNNMALKIETKD